MDDNGKQKKKRKKNTEMRSTEMEVKRGKVQRCFDRHAGSGSAVVVSRLSGVPDGMEV